MERETVGPKQFLGLEKNPRAKDIAELVVWLGYLKQHYRIKNAHPPEPILDDFGNIDHVDAVLTWDGDPAVPIVQGKEVYRNARKHKWPEAEYIIGNPPFIGGKDVRAELGDSYAEALWRVHEDINDSADFVMYWWDRAACELTRKGTKLQRLRLGHTNSITQVFSRRTVARYLDAQRPLSLIMAIADHPWTKATDKHAAVRIAMTVAAAGRHDGVLRKVTHEDKLDTDQPEIELSAVEGHINADLTVGVDITSTKELISSRGLCSPGVKLHGEGFMVTRAKAAVLGLGRQPGLERHIRAYRNGRDLTATPRGVMVIDLFGLEADEVRSRYPEIYQHVIDEVRDKVVIDRGTGERKRVGRAWNNRASYRDRWWVFGEPRSELRPALAGLNRYIATVETAKHRVFQFLDASILPDNMLVNIALDSAFGLGVLSSRPQFLDALRRWYSLTSASLYQVALLRSVSVSRLLQRTCGEDRVRRRGTRRASQVAPGGAP